MAKKTKADSRTAEQGGATDVDGIKPGKTPSTREIVQLLRRLLSETLIRNWRSYALAGIGLVIVAATTASMAWIMRGIVDQIFVDGDGRMLWPISIAVLAIFVVKGVATYFSSLTMTRIGNAIVATNRRRLFNHVMSLGLDYHSKIGSARIVNHVTSVARASKTVTELVVSSLLRDLLTLAGLVAVMVSQKPLLSLIALATAPIAIMGTARMAASVREFARDEMKAEAGVIRVVQEAARGIRDVKSYQFEETMRNRAHEATEWARYRSDFIARGISMTSPMMETLGGVAIATVILYGGWRAIEAGESPGAFVAFITALLLAYEPANRLARLRVTLSARMVAIRRMFAILDTEPTIRDQLNAKLLDVAAGQVHFESIRFSYTKKKANLFDDLSLKVPAKRMTAIIGPSGGGKSSLVNLLLRFHQPTSGRILIDGQDVAECSLHSLRSAISCVGQDVFLFDDTISENIRVGLPGADISQVKHAARMAGADEFIDALPDGYDSVVGENGVNLSGGQRQRLAIARAFLKPAPILVLDEATSALDPRTENDVVKSLLAKRGDTTIVLITHRLGIVRYADQICVMDKGKVAETGTHETLIGNGGLYAHLFALHELGIDALPEHSGR